MMMFNTEGPVRVLIIGRFLLLLQASLCASACEIFFPGPGRSVSLKRGFMTVHNTGGGTPPSRRWGVMAVVAALLLGGGMGVDKAGWLDEGKASPKPKPASTPAPVSTGTAPVATGTVASISTITVVVQLQQPSLFPWPMSTTAVVTSQDVVIQPGPNGIQVTVNMPAPQVHIPAPVLPAPRPGPAPGSTTRPTPIPAPTTRPTPAPTTRPIPIPDPERLVQAQRDVAAVLAGFPGQGCDSPSQAPSFAQLKAALERVFRLEDLVSRTSPSTDLARIRAAQLEQLELVRANTNNRAAYRELSRVTASMSALDSPNQRHWEGISAAYLGMSERGPLKRYVSELEGAYRRLYKLPSLR
jgi:hypothetical protein